MATHPRAVGLVGTVFENLSGADYPVEFHMVGMARRVWTFSESGKGVLTPVHGPLLGVDGPSTPTVPSA